MLRMSSDRFLKKILESNVGSIIKRGRPVKRWKTEVEEELQRWDNGLRQKVEDRTSWRAIIRKVLGVKCHST